MKNGTYKTTPKKRKLSSNPVDSASEEDERKVKEESDGEVEAGQNEEDSTDEK